MLLGLHYMDYYANDYAANQYLASRGFIVLSVNYRLGIGYGHAFHYPDGPARAARRSISTSSPAAAICRRGPTSTRARRHLGRIVRRLPHGAGARPQLRRVRRGRRHPRRARSRPGRSAREQLARALVGDGITEADYQAGAEGAYESSPVSSVATWKSPVLLIHADDDRNVQFHQTVDLKRRLQARA